MTNPLRTGSVRVTVILSTHNRCEDLARTLASLAASQTPNSVDWEVLVIDNASTDGTHSIVKGFSARYAGRFRYLYQAVPGKSLALNIAIRETRADILAFTDDDVSVEPSWLRNLIAPFEDPICAGVSGRTLAARDFSLPNWLCPNARYALAPLGLFDRGDEPRELTETPFGNNMAYKRAVFDKYGGFRNDLGPRVGGLNPQKSEDSEFGTRLLAAGEKLLYEPSAVLYHSTPKSRITKKYFLSWWFDKARADIRAFGVPSDTKWFIAGSPYYLYRRTAAWTLRWLFSLGSAQRFSCKVKVWANLGQIAECRRFWKQEKINERNSAG